jgi:hypothetical protein
MFFVLGISGAVFSLIGIIFYLRYTPPKGVLIEIPILLVSLSAFLINTSLLFCRGNSSPESRRQNILVTILVWTAIIYFFNDILPLHKLEKNGMADTAGCPYRDNGGNGF